MKRSWTALAVAIVAIFAVSGCNSYGNTFQGNTGGVITFLSPPNVNAGGPDLTLTVNGGGFIAKTVVQWNGKNLVTTLTTDGAGNVIKVTAVVPAALTAKAGTAFVQTLSPHTGAGNNGLSNSLAFLVFPPPNPPPTISAMKPSCAVAGSVVNPFTITIAGTNFIPASDPSGGSQVNWNAATQTTLSIVANISPTQIQATVSPTLIPTSVVTAVTVNVTVSNPPVPNSPSGGGGTSNALTFTIQPTGTTCPASALATATSQAQITVADETPAVSHDGRFVAYTATQENHAQVFLRDTCEAAATDCKRRTILLSAAENGAAANGDSRSPSMSSDGRFIAFSSAATNLVADAPAGRQIYLRDTCFGAAASCAPSTQLVSTDPNGALVGTESILPSVSASGRFVAFLAITPSHAPGESKGQASAPASSGMNSGFRQVFVRDTCFDAAKCTPATTRISLQPGDASSPDEKPAGPAISGAAGHIALADARTSTLFTRSVAVDDGVFLALTNKHQ
ncbi:MAG TPA: hypothetical protein VG051_04680 [Candidatus Acidoferrum sp.]|jgi:hypothetical protein|nr:hypothetical protein [Candidatus Acidoferrum sp.]